MGLSPNGVASVNADEPPLSPSGARTPLEKVAPAAHPLSAEFVSEAHQLLSKLVRASVLGAGQLGIYFRNYFHDVEGAIARQMTRALAVNFKYNMFAVRDLPSLPFRDTIPLNPLRRWFILWGGFCTLLSHRLTDRFFFSRVNWLYRMVYCDPTGQGPGGI
jgi:hypothetical protein